MAASASAAPITSPTSPPTSPPSYEEAMGLSKTSENNKGAIKRDPTFAAGASPALRTYRELGEALNSLRVCEIYLFFDTSIMFGQYCCMVIFFGENKIEHILLKHFGTEKV